MSVDPLATGYTVVGVDLSLTGTGIASNRGWVDLVGVKGLTVMPLVERLTALRELYGRVKAAVGVADLIVAEGPSLNDSGAGSVERNALWVNFVDWAILSGRDVAVVPPTNLKKYATGKGSAPKTQVIDAVARRFPQYGTKGNDNIADAVVLMAMGMDHLGFPLTPMPATHRVALDKIEWPK